jgi:ethanolamine-phosphate phospho-lyase
VVVMDGAYHGHTTATIDLSPYKFNGAGGTGRWVPSCKETIYTVSCLPAPHLLKHVFVRVGAHAALQLNCD